MTIAGRWFGYRMDTLNKPYCRRPQNRLLWKFLNPLPGRCRTFMLSSTTTLCSSRKVAAGLGIGLIAVSLMAPLSAQDTTLRAPAQAIAGQATSLATTGG